MEIVAQNNNKNLFKKDIFGLSMILIQFLNLMFNDQMLDIHKLLNHKWFDEVQNIDKKQYELYEQFMNNE